MPTYLLDTNILSDLVKNPSGKVAQTIAKIGERQIATSVIVAAELRFSAAKRGSQRLTTQIEAILGAIDIWPLQPPVDRYYAKVRAQLEDNGHVIGANDLLIAAHALSLSSILVTANVREFERVDGLVVENWLV